MGNFHMGRKYGYLWWVSEYPYQERKVNAFQALGAGGQNVTVIRISIS